MENYLELAQALPQHELPAGYQRGFVLEPATFYPAVIDKLQADNIITEADAVLGKMSYRLLGNLSPRQRVRREEVQEVARLWLTELLHEEVGHVPMYIRITKDNDWKL